MRLGVPEVLLLGLSIGYGSDLPPVARHGLAFVLGLAALVLLVRRLRRPSAPRWAAVAMVRAWHEKYGQQIREESDAAATDWQIAFRHWLHSEEVAELHVAMLDRDVVAIAREIADVLYVVYGTALSYGIPIEDVFAEVHRANMTKVRRSASELREDLVKPIGKPPGWRPPDVARVLGREARP